MKKLTKVRYGVQWTEFTTSENLVVKDKTYSTAAKRDEFINSLAGKDSFIQIDYKFEEEVEA